MLIPLDQQPISMPQHTWQHSTTGRGAHEITDHIQHIVQQDGINTGLCHIFCQHTSCGLMITEQTDPAVLHDTEDFFAKLIPDGLHYRHHAEGADDMPAHIRSVLCQCELTIPINQSALALGTWQGIFLYEHRIQSHRRNLLITTWAIS
jgi:secondary thiamine-phosphate synthase enzyme